MIFLILVSILAKHNPRAALSRLNQSSESQESYARDLLNVNLLFRLQRFTDALNSFNSSLIINSNSTPNEIDQVTNSLVNLTRRLALPSLDDHFWVWLAFGLLNIEEPLKGLISLNTAVKIIETFSNVQQRLNFHKLLYERGILFLERQFYEEAIDSFSKALEIDPSFFLAWCMKGVALNGIEKYEEAVSCFDQAIDLNPYLHNAWKHRGIALYESFHSKEANGSFEQAISLDNTDYEVFYYKGKSLRRLGTHTEAISRLEQALELAQENYTKVWNELGWAIFDLNENGHGYENALEHWQQELNRLLPKDSENETISELFSYSIYGISSTSWTTKLRQPMDWRLKFLGRGISSQQFPSSTSSNQTGSMHWLEGLDLAISVQEIDSKGCGLLYQSIGRAHQEYGNKLTEAEKSNEHLEKSKISYQYALRFFNVDESCQERLEVLKDLLLICRSLEDTEELYALGIDGRDTLARLLKQHPSKAKQFNLLLKFISFKQLRVDELAYSQNADAQQEALELAEHHRKQCLRHFNYGRDDSNSGSSYAASYAVIQKELADSNPDAAIIYWNISPATLTTFILTPNNSLLVWKSDNPKTVWARINHQLGKWLSVFGKKKGLRTFHYPQGIKQLKDLEKWLKDWESRYKDYSHESKLTGNRREHPWRKDLNIRLQELSEILEIPYIYQKIRTENPEVQKIVLIPHRELHLLPLHYLFLDNQNEQEQLSIQYLPSAEIGISLKNTKESLGQKLLVARADSDRPAIFSRYEAPYIQSLHYSVSQLS